MFNGSPNKTLLSCKDNGKMKNFILFSIGRVLSTQTTCCWLNSSLTSILLRCTKSDTGIYVNLTVGCLDIDSGTWKLYYRPTEESKAHFACHMPAIYVASWKGVLRRDALGTARGRATETCLPEIQEGGGHKRMCFLSCESQQQCRAFTSVNYGSALESTRKIIYLSL